MAHDPDVAELVAAKERLGTTISVCLPARNEEPTVGQIVANVRRNLVERAPLVDEVVVMDDGSTDATADVARWEGARVLAVDEVLPDVSEGTGKGNALWTSLYACEGDIVCWLDADVRNFGSQFVTRLLEPLLRDRGVGFVKGYYRRPLHGEATGGGRVTELMARPLINLFYPELSGMIQPLSGEYAGRRALLERLPFFTGYAVEIGLLIDVLDQAGLHALGQVDLERRIHRNQPLPNLSQMAYVILQGAIRKLEERHRLELLTEVGRGMKLINTGKDNFNLEVREIGDEIRPPMVTIPAYAERRRALKDR